MQMSLTWIANTFTNSCIFDTRIGKTQTQKYGQICTIDDDHQCSVQGYAVTGLGLMGCVEQGSENPVVSKKTLETQKKERVYSTKIKVYLRETP